MKHLTYIITISLSYGLIGCSEATLVHDYEVLQKSVSLKITHYCPTDDYQFTEVFSYNSSSMLDYDHHITDFDRDGLSDEFESQPQLMSQYNISSLLNDTNGDGYTDLLINLIGYDIDNQVRLNFCEQPLQDTDRDGLRDCEERVIQIDETDPDTDRDGIPDGLEVRFGTNPADPMDSISDLDHDGLTAIEEIKRNTPHKTTNNHHINDRAYSYAVDTFTEVNPSTMNEENCYEILISNIPVMNVDNGNLLKVFVTERKTIEGQGEVNRVKNLTVLVPQGVANESVVLIDDIQNQTVDGINVPLVFEEENEGQI